MKLRPVRTAEFCRVKIGRGWRRRRWGRRRRWWRRGRRWRRRNWPASTGTAWAPAARTKRCASGRGDNNFPVDRAIGLLIHQDRPSCAPLRTKLKSKVNNNASRLLRQTPNCASNAVSSCDYDPSGLAAHQLCKNERALRRIFRPKANSRAVILEKTCLKS